MKIIAAILLALGAVEGLAYWWMHPAPAGLGEPVLCYKPESRGQRSEVTRQEEAGLDRRAGPLVANGADREGHAEDSAQEETQDPAQSPTSLSTLNPQPSTSSSSPSTINSQPSTSSITPLPEIYDKAAPMLRCSSGQVFHTQLNDTLGLHLAFFEWDGTDTGSVLEAFRHMPEACMGAIGMKLVSKEKPIPYSIGDETLLFDHTLFREPGQTAGLFVPGPLVHAFRAVWVSGLSHADARQGLGGDEFDRLRTIRIKSALTRFRPSHARVIQGAVRGAPNGEAAWQAFEQSMLKDLQFAKM